MAHQQWISIKNIYCERRGCEVSFEANVIIPEDILPDQSIRVTAHRCSHADLCNAEEKASCLWAGTNPNYDPFQKASSSQNE